MFAAVGGHNDTVDLLLSEGADVNVQVRATQEYMERAARDLAEGKEDVEPHKEGLSALMLAARMAIWRWLTSSWLQRRAAAGTTP